MVGKEMRRRKWYIYQKQQPISNEIELTHKDEQPIKRKSEERVKPEKKQKIETSEEEFIVILFS